MRWKWGLTASWGPHWRRASYRRAGGANTPCRLKAGYGWALKLTLGLIEIVYTVQGRCPLDDRKVDYRGFHRGMVFFGAFLALTTGIASQQNTAASRSLPDIKQLLADVRDNQKQIDSLKDQYSCTETEEIHELDKNGQVKKSMVSEYEVFYLGGRSIRRQVKKDGRPLSPGDQKKEDDRVEKRIREYEKKHREEEEDAAGKKERVDISTFLRVSRFANPRRGEFREHAVVIFDFAPNPDYKPQNKTEDILHKLVGTMWVDDEARQVARLDAHLSDTFKLGGGPWPQFARERRW